MASLFRREWNFGEQAADLGGIIVLDGRLEAFARGQRLRQLTS